MNKYTFYCTKEQTIRAYKLGAPIDSVNTCALVNHPTVVNIDKTGDAFYLPTTAQMCGWLREKGLYVEIYMNGETYLKLSGAINTEDDGEIYAQINPSDKYESIIISAIDVALEYLEKQQNVQA